MLGAVTFLEELRTIVGRRNHGEEKSERPQGPPDQRTRPQAAAEESVYCSRARNAAISRASCSVAPSIGIALWPGLVG